MALVEMSRTAASFRLAVVLLVSIAPALGGAASAPAAPAGHYGGTITIGTSTQPNSLDPTQTNDPGFRRIVPSYCLPLYTYASNHGGPVELDPILAAAPPKISPDKLAYTIQLRQGIQFNDGTPFNAQAVVASFQRYTTYPGSARASDFVGVGSATAAGQYTVVYHLTQRNSAFTGNMYPLSPAAIAKEGSGFSSDPICVGPFMVDSWTPGVSTVLVKSPYYYKRGAVYLDKIVVKVLADLQADLAALQAGDIQVVQDSSVPPPTSPNFTVIKGAQLGWGGLVVNIGNKNGTGNPYSNVGSPLAQSPKLRQAFEEAIDRSTDVRVALNGIGETSCTLIPSDDTAWYPQTKVPCTPYDPKDAKRLAAASGYPLPITVHLQIAAGSSAGLVEAQVLQSEEAAVGFNVMIDVLAGAAYSAALASGNFDVAVQAQQPNDPDPNSYIYPFLDSAGVGNRAGYSNPRLDYVLANALRATDPTARAVDYRVAQQIVHADRPIIVLRENASYGIFDSSLKGIQFDPFGILLYANAQYKS